jgi:hypothetical protein
MSEILEREKNISPETVFETLRKWKKLHEGSDHPWGLPYSRLFLNKWQSYSWYFYTSVLGK